MLGLNTTLEALLQVNGTKVLGYEPSLMLALDDTCRLQCRLNIETLRTNAYQIRTNHFPEGADHGLLHGAAILGEADRPVVCRGVSEPAENLHGFGGESHHPGGDQAVEPDDRE